MLLHQMVKNRAIERALERNACPKPINPADLSRQAIQVSDPDGEVLANYQRLPTGGEATTVRGQVRDHGY
jgi:hypothetical protein